MIYDTNSSNLLLDNHEYTCMYEKSKIPQSIHNTFVYIIDTNKQKSIKQ